MRITTLFPVALPILATYCLLSSGRSNFAGGVQGFVLRPVSISTQIAWRNSRLKRATKQDQDTGAVVHHESQQAPDIDAQMRLRSIEEVPTDYIREYDTLSQLLQNTTSGSILMKPSPTSQTKPETASDFLTFVGGRSQMEQDETLRLMSSELSVWNEFRKQKAESSPGLPLDLLLERAWDTVEDIFVHLRRIPYEKGWADLEENDIQKHETEPTDVSDATTTMSTLPRQEQRRKTIVILGSGWAAHALMKIADTTKFRLVVVSPSNHFVFTPMLASAAVGTVEYRSMTEAVRAANPLIHEYVEGKATAVDVHNKTVTVRLNNLLKDMSDLESPTISLEYDHLVCAVGSKVDDRGVPGADKALRLKSTDDARKLRTAIGECFEYASRPDVAGKSPELVQERSRRVTFLIVGGGPTGVELAGELVDLFADVTRPHKGTYPKLKDSVRVILAHGGPDLVPQFEPALRKEALKALEKKGVEVILNTRVTELGDDVGRNGFAKLSTKVVDPITGDFTGEREEKVIPVGLSVWCAGTAPAPFVENLLSQLPGEARYRDGRVQVDRWMRPPMPETAEAGSVFVLGDAAAASASRGQERTDGTGDSLLPATAQVAGQQGAFVARLLDRDYDLTLTPPQLSTTSNASTTNTLDMFEDPAMAQWLKFRGLETAPPFGFLNLGMLAYLGGGEALTQVQMGDINLFAWAGSVAYLLWRSVYLVKQVATRNRVLVTFDWIKSSLFGRDITRL